MENHPVPIKNQGLLDLSPSPSKSTLASFLAHNLHLQDDRDNKENNSFLLNSSSNSHPFKVKKSSKSKMGDRFIPARNQKQMEFSSYRLTNQEEPQEDEPSQYSQLINDAIFNSPNRDPEQAGLKRKINNFKVSKEKSVGFHEQMNNVYFKTHKATEKKKAPRILPQVPEKILDAPELLNDYYLNLLDWGNNGALAVSLGQSVYLWREGEIQQLLGLKDETTYVCSVSWAGKGNTLAVGLSNNVVQVWDAEKYQLLRTLTGHESRVSAVCWNSCILSTGSRDSNIHNHDVRIQQSIVSKFSSHASEICGLKWSWDGSTLASGSNDNSLMIWDLNYNQPRHILREHSAAVKAVAWCPLQKNLLATGGGTSDRSIKFWNTDTGQMLSSHDTNNQVCALIWSKYERELLSSHGFSSTANDSSKNNICLWKYPSMGLVGELKGHSERVLHMAMSPDGETVVSAGADETLRFWKVFEAPPEQKKEEKKKLFLNDLR